MSDVEARQQVVSAWSGASLELFELIEIAVVKAATQDLSPTNLANEAVLGIVHAMGGRVIYIPRGHRYSQEQRNKEMFELWKRHDTSVSDLAKKYKLSSAAIYEIISNFAKEDGLEKSNNRFIK